MGQRDWRQPWQGPGEGHCLNCWSGVSHPRQQKAATAWPRAAPVKFLSDGGWGRCESLHRACGKLSAGLRDRPWALSQMKLARATDSKVLSMCNHV